jgi:prepilin-type N-terminal cleavage/methylation domain-containing protein
VNTRTCAFTLVEITVALALLGVVALGVAAVVSHMEAGRAVMSAKADAEASNHELFDRLSTYFRTRAVTRADGGFAAKPTAVDIFRSGKPDASGKRVTERVMVRQICKKLAPKELTTAARLKLSPAVLANAVAPLCNFKCPVGSRPVVLMRRWPDLDNAPSSKTDTVFPPAARFTESAPLAAGLCVTQGADDVRFVAGTVWPRPEGSLMTEKKDFTAPLKEDASKIEFLPP